MGTLNVAIETTFPLTSAIVSDVSRTWFGCGSEVVRRWRELVFGGGLEVGRSWLERVFGSGADSPAEVKGKWFRELPSRHFIL